MKNQLGRELEINSRITLCCDTGMRSAGQVHDKRCSKAIGEIVRQNCDTLLRALYSKEK